MNTLENAQEKAKEEAEAWARGFLAHKVAATPTEGWPRGLLSAAILSGSVRIEARGHRLVCSVGARPIEVECDVECEAEDLAQSIVRSIAASLAFTLDEMVFGAQQIVEPQRPAKFHLGSAEVAAYIQGIARQARPSALSPYGFDVCLVLRMEQSQHRLHIETSNTFGRPCFVSAVRLEPEP